MVFRCPLSYLLLVVAFSCADSFLLQPVAVPRTAGQALRSTNPDVVDVDYKSVVVKEAVIEDVVVEKVATSSARVFVAGASGFVGSKVCEDLVNLGCSVIGMSRKGRPEGDEDWLSKVEWITGSALETETYKGSMSSCDAVVSCVGGFGATDSYMQLVNGDCNVKLAEVAKEAGVGRFVFVSVHEYKLPKPLDRAGYFAGKRKAEAAVTTSFAENGYILRPAAIYGKRKVTISNPVTSEEKKLVLPLERIGKQIARITALEPIKKLATSGLPFADLVYTQPLSVEEVATAAARCAAGTATGTPNILEIDDIAMLKNQ